MSTVKDTTTMPKKGTDAPGAGVPGGGAGAAGTGGTAPRAVTIDATNRRLGRLASEIATVLNGKDTPAYRPNVAPNVSVTVSHASRMQITDKKRKTKIYERYTGYFGGRRTVTLERLIEKKGYGEALRKAVYGMLPDNRLRAVKMKKLHIQEN